MRFGTKLIHHPYSVDKQTGALSTPIYQVSTYHQESLDANQEFQYSRSENPTRKALEETIALLEGGDRGFAFSSGMAATSSVLSVFSANDHIIICEDVYGGTYRIASQFFSRFNFEISFVDATDINAIQEAIKPNTKGIYLETPSNPTMKITDIKAVSEVAQSKDIIVMVDNTFMSPYLQRPIELGAHIVLHSGTKFIGGHSDVISGLVVAKGKELCKRIYAVQNGFGAVLGPQDSWLLLRGIKTLKVRMDYQQNNAKALAEWLTSQPSVKKVYYPGLADHVGSTVHQKQADGPGAVLSFELKDRKEARAFMDTVKCAAVAVSLGGVETIVSYPAMMSHASMPKEEREKRGITEGLIRVSVGLEDLEDLIDDFKLSLKHK